MKAKLITLIVFLVALVSCESTKNNTPNGLGEVTVKGTFTSVANPCPKGSDPCLPGMEVALSADKIYYLNNIHVEEIFDEQTLSTLYILDGDTLMETDSVQIRGNLFEYIDKHDNKYYRINVNEYNLL